MSAGKRSKLKPKSAVNKLLPKNVRLRNRVRNGRILQKKHGIRRTQIKMVQSSEPREAHANSLAEDLK